MAILVLFFFYSNINYYPAKGKEWSAWNVLRQKGRKCHIALDRDILKNISGNCEWRLCANAACRSITESRSKS